MTEPSISCSFRDLFVLLFTLDDGIVGGGLVKVRCRMASVVKNAAERKRAAQRTPVIGKSITLDVRGAELVARLTARIRWHRSRAHVLGLALKARAPGKEGAEGKLDDWHRDAATKEMERKCREHEERSVFLAFVRDHLARGVVYRLGGSDLRMLEIMPDAVHWW